MKIASISGVTHYVKDIEKTADFYAKLGFRLGTQDENGLTVYINWFWIRFQVVNTGQIKMDSSISLNLKVVNVDEFYDEVIEAGIAPLTQPEDQPWGHREFRLQDPDGYTLVFFQKLK